MISSVLIDNFKALSGLDFATNGLTVLTGGNCVGKSTFIQCLLLGRLAATRDHSSPTIVPLNGALGLSLGEYTDILTRSTISDPDIHFTYIIDGHEVQLALSTTTERSRYVDAVFKPRVPEELSSRLFGAFVYIGAERKGPRDFETVASVSRDLIEIGPRGEGVAEVLTMYDREAVAPILEHPSMLGQRFSKQVEGWLSDMVPYVEVRLDSSPDLGVVALRFKQGGVAAEWDRPSNTGFGISQSLPIIVAGLMARPGSILVIDSPEAHLHSAGQSAMGSFLGRVAATGIQVFVETHSEHILNGIRLAVARGEHPLSRDIVCINHLTSVDGRVEKTEIIIDEYGGLSSWPEGFFDQTEKDLAALVKSRGNLLSKAQR